MAQTTRKFCCTEGRYVTCKKFITIKNADPELARRATVVAEKRCPEKFASLKDEHKVICIACYKEIYNSIQNGEIVVRLRSTIPKSGRGLFTTVDCKKGDWQTDYGGLILPKTKVPDLLDKGVDISHLMDLDRSRSVNGQFFFRQDIPGRCFKGMAQFVNTADEDDDSNVTLKKGFSKLGGNRISLVVTADTIKAGTELKGDYFMYDMPKVSEEDRVHEKKKRIQPPHLVKYHLKVVEDIKEREEKELMKAQRAVMLHATRSLKRRRYENDEASVSATDTAADSLSSTASPVKKRKTEEAIVAEAVEAL